MSEEETSGRQIFREEDAATSFVISHWELLKCISPLKANIEWQCLQSLKATAGRGLALEKWAAFSKKINIPPVDSFTIIMDFPIVVMFIAFPLSWVF